MKDTVSDRGASSGLAEIAAELRGIREALSTVFRGEPQSKESQAIQLIYDMDSPSLAKIAKALGYANHTSLRHMRKFRFAWKAFELMQDFEPGAHRASGQRRNGRSIDTYDGTEN